MYIVQQKTVLDQERVFLLKNKKKKDFQILAESIYLQGLEY